MVSSKMLMDSIHRAIRTIREDKDAGGKAQSALRALCVSIIEERDRSWLNVADELVAERLSKMAQEGEPELGLQLLDRLNKSRSDTEHLRAFLKGFAQRCGAFNICFLAAGFGHWEEHYRSQEQGNAIESIYRVISLN